MKNNTEKTLGIAIFDVSRAIRRNFDHQSQEFGLSRALWSVLAKLQYRDGLKQIELADVMEIRPITLVKHLDKLEKDGWIVRKDDASDRRAKRIYLTKKAKPMIESLNELAVRVRKKALQGISKEEVAQLMKMLFKINDNLADNKLS